VNRARGALAGARAALLLTVPPAREAVAAGWLVFTLATARWMDWGEPIRLHYTTDELQYEALARAAPGLPTEPVTAAAGQRLAPHWIVGVLCDASGIGLHTLYRLVALVVLAALALVVARLTASSGLPLWASAIALGLVMTNPYTCRLLVIAPAMLSDTILVLGSALALLGLVEANAVLAIVGAIVSVCGREGGLAVATGVCVWFALRRRAHAAFAAAAAPALIFAALKIIGSRASLPNPSASDFTVVGPLLHLSRHARELAEHTARVILASPVAVAVLVVALLLLSAGRRRVRRASPLAASLLLTVLLFLQPLAFNPAWVHENESRLASLGIVPLALAAALSWLEIRRQPSRLTIVVTLAAVAVSSLQHRYTWGATYETPARFVGIAVAAAVVVAALVVREWSMRSAVQQSSARPT